MRSTTIREMPDELIDALQAAADASGRTLEQEILHRLASSLRKEASDTEALLEFARQLRARIRKGDAPLVVDEAELDQAKRSGRP